MLFTGLPINVREFLHYIIKTHFDCIPWPFGSLSIWAHQMWLKGCMQRTKMASMAISFVTHTFRWSEWIIIFIKKQIAWLAWRIHAEPLHHVIIMNM